MEVCFLGYINAEGLMRNLSGILLAPISNMTGISPLKPYPVSSSLLWRWWAVIAAPHLAAIKFMMQLWNKFQSNDWLEEENLNFREANSLKKVSNWLWSLEYLIKGSAVSKIKSISRLRCRCSTLRRNYGDLMLSSQCEQTIVNPN